MCATCYTVRSRVNIVTMALLQPRISNSSRFRQRRSCRCSTTEDPNQEKNLLPQSRPLTISLHVSSRYEYVNLRCLLGIYYEFGFGDYVRNIKERCWVNPLHNNNGITSLLIEIPWKYHAMSDEIHHAPFYLY